MIPIHLIFSILIAISIWPHLAPAISRPGMITGRCSLTIFKSMKAYDCAGLNLSEIPIYLTSNTEILDISFNRIRQLTNASFKHIANLKKLYLNDNMILTIETGAFDDLDDLDTLDLSMNSLIEMPVSVFHLESLENLYLTRNIRLNILNLFEQAAPITAPIKHLDISYSPLLNQLPQLGIMMDLVHLNISGNYITNISIANFVGLCNLQWFTFTNSTIEFNSDCDCEHIQNWFNVMNVQSIPKLSTRCEMTNKCDRELQPASEFTDYQKCIEGYQDREYIRKILYVSYISLIVIGSLLLIFCVCYVYTRFQRFSDDEDDKQTKTKNDSLLLTLNNENEL